MDEYRVLKQSEIDNVVDPARVIIKDGEAFVSTQILKAVATGWAVSVDEALRAGVDYSLLLIPVEQTHLLLDLVDVVESRLDTAEKV